MNAMPVLSFHSTVFDVVDRNGEPWLRSPQIAGALGYNRADRIADIYNRNAAEFTDRIFRAMLRSCRAAGVPLARAIACAADVARRRTGVDPLAEASAILESAAARVPAPVPSPVDPFISCIRDWLAASGARRTTAEEIARDCLLLAVGRRGPARAVAVRIGVAMKRIGWLKRRESGGRRGYYYLRPEGWGWNQ